MQRTRQEDYVLRAWHKKTNIQQYNKPYRCRPAHRDHLLRYARVWHFQGIAQTSLFVAVHGQLQQTPASLAGHD